MKSLIERKKHGTQTLSGRQHYNSEIFLNKMGRKVEQHFRVFEEYVVHENKRLEKAKSGPDVSETKDFNTQMKIRNCVIRRGEGMKGYNQSQSLT